MSFTIPTMNKDYQKSEEQAPSKSISDTSSNESIEDITVTGEDVTNQYEDIPVHEVFENEVGFEEAPKLAETVKRNFTPEAIYEMTDAEYALQLSQDLSKDEARDTLQVLHDVPDVNPQIYLGAKGKEKRKLTNDEINAQNNAEWFHYYHRKLADNMANPMAINVVANDTLLKQAIAVYHDKYSPWYSQAGRALRSGVSGILRGVADAPHAVFDSISYSANSYVKDIENGGDTLNQIKTKSQISDQEVFYNNQIEALNLALEKSNNTDTAIKISEQILDLEDKRDKTIEELSSFANNKREQDLQAAKQSAKLITEIKNEHKAWVDEVEAFNQIAPDVDGVEGFAYDLIGAAPQMALFFASSALEAPGVAMTLIGSTSFTSMYRSTKERGADSKTALVTALSSTIPEILLEKTGINIVSGFRNMLKQNAVKRLTGKTIKELTKKNIKEAFKTVLDESGVEFVQGMSSGIIQEAALAIDGIQDFQDVIKNVSGDILVDSLESGLIAAIYTSVYLPGVIINQRQRLKNSETMIKHQKEVADKIKQSETYQKNPDVSRDIVSKSINSKNDLYDSSILDPELGENTNDIKSILSKQHNDAIKAQNTLDILDSFKDLPEKFETYYQIDEDYNSEDLPQERIELENAHIRNEAQTTRIDPIAFKDAINNLPEDEGNKLLNKLEISRGDIEKAIDKEDFLEVDHARYLHDIATTDVGEALAPFIMLPNQTETLAQAKVLGDIAEKVNDAVRTGKVFLSSAQNRAVIKKKLSNLFPNHLDVTDGATEMILSTIENFGKGFKGSLEDANDFTQQLINGLTIAKREDNITLIPKNQDIDTEAKEIISAQDQAENLEPIRAEDITIENTNGFDDPESQRFVLAPDGNIDWGYIDENISDSIGYKTGPIRLQVGHDKGGHGFGLVHMIKGNKKGGKDLNLLYDILNNFDEIHLSKGRLVLVKEGTKKKQESAFVELITNDYYSVITQYGLIKNQRNKMPLLWSRSATESVQDSTTTEDLARTSQNPTHVHPSQDTEFRADIAITDGGEQSAQYRKATTKTSSSDNIPSDTELVNQNPEEYTTRADALVLGNNQELVKKAATQYNIDPDELLGEAWEAAQKAEESFDETRGNLDKRIEYTIFRTAENIAIKEGKIASREQGTEDIVDFEEENNTQNNEEFNQQIFDATSEYLGTLEDQTYKQVFDMVRKGDKAQKQIAEELGLKSQQRVSDIILKKIPKLDGVKELTKKFEENRFNQNEDGIQRAEIQLNPNSYDAVITLFEKGSLDSLIHEIAHWQLHVLSQMVDSGIADNRIVDLFNDIKTQYGVKANLTHEQHETFAKDFEKYIYEGKAPAPRLYEAFKVFKRFLLDFYKHVKAKFGNSFVKPEIASIFDRILATNEEIEVMAESENLTKDAQSIINDIRQKNGLANNKKQEADKEQKAKDKAISKLLKAFKKSGGYKLADQEAETTVDNMPVYQAIDKIVEHGGLDYDSMLKFFGKPIVERLKKHKSGTKALVKKNGNKDIDLIEIAEGLGYNTQNDPYEIEEQLINDITNAKLKNETLKERKAINREEADRIFRESIQDAPFKIDNSNGEDLILDSLLLESEAVKSLELEEEAKTAESYKKLEKARHLHTLMTEKAREEIENMPLNKAVNYKKFRQKLKKKIKKVGQKLQSVHKAQETDNDQKVRQLLQEASKLQHERAMAYILEGLSIQAYHQHMANTRKMNYSSIMSRLKNVNEKYIKSIVDALITWNIPSAFNKDGSINEKILKAAGFDEFNNSDTLLLPKEAKTPIEEKLLFSPEEIIPAWIKSKAKSTIHNDYRKMSFREYNDLTKTIDTLLKMGKKEFVGIKEAKKTSLNDAVNIFIKNTEDIKDKHNPNNHDGNGSLNKLKDAGIKAKRGFKTRFQKFFNTMGADFLMMEYQFREMDGYDVGFFTNNIFDNFHKAELSFIKRKKDFMDRIRPHLNTMHLEMQRLKKVHNGNEKFSIDGVKLPEKWIEYNSIPGTDNHWTAEMVFAACFNMGNDSTLNSLVTSLDLGGAEYKAWLKEVKSAKNIEKAKPKLERNPDTMNIGSKEFYEKRIEFAKSQLEAIQSQISENGWNAIQSIWNELSSLFPDYNKAIYETSGHSIPKEPATPITIRTADNTTMNMAGGYWPARYDNTVETFTNEASRDSQNILDRKNVYINATMNKDASIARMRDNKGVATVTRMPLLNVSTILSNHISDTLRMVTHGRIVKDFDMLMHNEKFKDRFIKKFGVEKYNKLERWGVRQGIPDIDKPRTKGWKILNKIRALNTVAVLGMNAKTAAKQLLSIPVAMNEMSKIGKSSGYIAFLNGARMAMYGSIDNMDLGNTAFDFVREASDYIKLREDSAYNIALSDFTENFTITPKLEIFGQKVSKKELADLSFSFIRMADRMAVMPIWLGAFNQALQSEGIVQRENLKEYLSASFENPAAVKRSIKKADRVVRSTQPSTFTPDLSHAQSDSLLKLFTSFSTYTLKAFNRTMYTWRGFKANKVRFNELMKTFADTFIMPSIFEMLIATLLLPDEDEPEFIDWLINPALQAQGAIPFLRSLSLKRLGANPLDISAIHPTEEFTKGLQQLYSGHNKKGALTLTNLTLASIALAPKNAIKSYEQLGELLTQGELDSKKERRKENK